MKKNRSLISLLLCLLLLSALCVQAAADGDAEKKECSISLYYNIGSDKPMADVAFDIYRVADFKEGRIFELTEPFKTAGVMLNGIDNNETWLRTAATLSTFATANELTPYATASTDAAGTVKFTGIDEGLYLIVGAQKEIDGTFYKPTPFMLCLPFLQEGRWAYDMTSNVKHTEEKPDPIPTVNHEVLKVWDDSNAVNQRPSKITVRLTKNGKVYDTKDLTRDDNWRYTWEELPANDENGAPITWSVLEDSISGYTVSSKEQGITTVITNTKQSSTPSGPSTPYLPQTGLNWKPVYMLGVMGMLFLIMGFAVKKGKTE